MAIPESFLDELIDRTDITELVGGYVRFTKKSGGNMFAVCPFHSEKTPSFSVNSDLQIYHCFGCGKGGSAITFIREIENLPFRDAVEVLAKRAGMTVPQEEGRGEFTSRRKRILELNKDAARFFHLMLASARGEKAREYLASRKISKATVTKFGIGAAPNDWTCLQDAMIKKGYSKQELIDAGLCRVGQKDRGMYDFFRDRLVFPVIDVRGEVIAFSARALDPEAKSYKYLNSPDTIAFSKGRNLFGLNFARKSKADMLILVEGNIDVVMLHQAGFDSAVAPLGTAFTAEQARLLSQYTNKIVIAFDGDESGQRATLKALPLIEATGVSARVIELGEGGDPDDFIKKRGADAFKILLERGENHIEYRLQMIQRNHDLNTDEGRLSYLAESTEYLTKIANAPEREVYGAFIAKAAAVSVESVRNEINRKIKIMQRKAKKDAEKTVIRAKAGIAPASRELRYENHASAVAEEGIIRSIIQDQTLIKTAREMGFSAQEFSAEFLAEIYRQIERQISEDKEISRAVLMSRLEPGQASHLTKILQKPESISEGDKAIKKYISKIRVERLSREKPSDEILLEIKRYKSKSDLPTPAANGI
ncbi:MAG: DNA primase [Oscillospiraceae bacterium]|nr:DNA primase [Oscillospiraceae bacterium]